MKRIPETGIAGIERLREAATGEFRQIMELVQAAVVAKLGLRPEQRWDAGIEAIFHDRVVIRRDGRFWSYAYTLSADNQVTLGDAQEVVETYLPVKMSEAKQGFIEATDGEGLAWEATLIRAGLSLNNIFYPDSVLREAVALFEGRTVFAKGDIEHLRGDGKDVRNIVGWISAPRFVEGASPDTGRIVGTVNFSKAASAVRELLADAWKRGKKDLAGLSIDADGTAKSTMREGKRVKVAASIKKVNSVDLIVEPGAGGGLVRMIESVNQENDTMKQRMLEAIKQKLPQKYAQLNVDTATDDEIEALYREAIAPAPNTAGPTSEQVAEQIRMVEARANARSAIAASNLPQPAKDRVWARFEKLERFAEADVTAALKEEREYLAKMTESGRVVIPGDIEVEDRSTKVGGMLDAFFDPEHKDHASARSFKECYIEITGDRRVTGRLDQCDLARLREAAGASFRESLDSASWGNVLGNSITRRMIADYRVKSQYDIWRLITGTPVPLSDVRTQERTRYGGYGDLPTVNQGAPYAALASPTDEKSTYAPAKRGGTEDVTLEMIKNDDVGAIRQIPVKLSRSAKRTLSKFVLDFFKDNVVIYDGVALFHATHGNLGAAALDATSLAARRLAMLKQTEADSLDRLSIGPKYIFTPVDLQEAAVNLFNRSTNNDKTFVQDLALTVVPVWYWTDTNDWMLAADPMDLPGFELGFMDGNEEPELFIQDNPTSGSMFTHDKVTYKIRHWYGGNILNYRGFDKSVVA